MANVKGSIEKGTAYVKENAKPIAFGFLSGTIVTGAIAAVVKAVSGKKDSSKKN